MSSRKKFVALDWGTSSLRAFVLDDRGDTLEHTVAPLGILKVADQNFDAVFEQLCAPWFERHGELPALASGMIGSRQGWREATYVDCPADMGDLANRLTRFSTRHGRRLAIVPGLTCVNAFGVPDVMRGEETQIAGALGATGIGQALFVLPGTHCKWALLQDGRVVSFATFMTGEVFEVLREHSILAKTMDGRDYDARAFDRGCEYAKAECGKGAGLLHALFSARTLRLTEGIAANAAHAYLSGLLIATEMADALRYFVAAPRTITLIGEPALCELYQRAARHFGVTVNVAPQDVTRQGLWQIARAANLI